MTQTKCTYLFILFLIFFIANCNKNNNSVSEPGSFNVTFDRSMKGWELYGWDVSNEHYFTIIAGTNRSKTTDEIVSDGNICTEEDCFKVKVKGIDSLKSVLTKLPDREFISCLRTPDNSYTPLPTEIIEEIKLFCEETNLDLM